VSYKVLARKWRPQRFEDVIGQRAVTQTLRNAIASRRIAHSFVFAGPRGVGKTTTARILARGLNCEQGPTADPCGVCDACVEIADGRDMDVLEIDAATHTGVDKVRDVIITSMLKKVDVAVYDFIASVVDGNFTAGPVTYDLEKDGVGYSTSGGQIDDITSKLDEYKAQIIDGSITVPTE